MNPSTWNNVFCFNIFTTALVNKIMTFTFEFLLLFHTATSFFAKFPCQVPRSSVPPLFSLQTHDMSHTDTLVTVHLRLAARLDTWLDSSLLCLSTPHMLWTREENTLQASAVRAYQRPTRTWCCALTILPWRESFLPDNI